MKHFAVADVHGCYKTLEKLLSTLPIEKDDIVIFLGDYIDRGPSSLDTVCFVESMIDENPHWIALRGNHEDLYLNAIINPNENNNIILWLQNGGHITYKELYDNDLPKDIYKSFFEILRYYYETDEYIFVHGGIFKTPDQTPLNDLLWNRNTINETNKTIITGHTLTPLSTILLNTKNVVCIDNGCFYKEEGYGNLVAYCPETLEFFYQQNIDEI